MRAKLNYHLPIVPTMILFIKSNQAKNIYQDEIIQFRFNLIKLWEENPQILLEADAIELYPFVPLMKNGKEYVFETERKLYNSRLKNKDKSNLLTALAVFTGMRNPSMAEALWERRRDMVVEESSLYKTFLDEGIERGREQGIELGWEKGHKDGYLKGIRLALELKFGTEGLDLYNSHLKDIDSIEVLESIEHALLTAEDINKIKNLIHHHKKEN